MSESAAALLDLQKSVVALLEKNPELILERPDFQLATALGKASAELDRLGIEHQHLPSFMGSLK